MAYGLQVFNSNGAVQIDTELDTSFQVIASGSIAGGASLAYNKSKEIVFINRPNTGATLIDITDTAGYVKNEATGSVNYVKCAEIKRASTGVFNTESYGIECYDASSNIQFSSRLTQGFNLVATWSSGTRSNGSDVYTGDPTGIYCACYPMKATGGSNVQNQFYFTYGTGAKIQYQNSISSGGSTYTFLNQSAVFILDLKG